MVIARSWLRLRSGSNSQIAGTQTTKNSTVSTPQPWSFCSSGVSRSGSEGPGRIALRDVLLHGLAPAPQEQDAAGDQHEHGPADGEDDPLRPG